MRAPLLAALILSMVTAGAARAGISGSVGVQGQASHLFTIQPNGSTTTSSMVLLQENLFLHYAGLPFDPGTALLTLGGQFANANGSFSGRTATVDMSVGLFPRRAYPLRLYARLSSGSGVPGGFAGFGAGPSLLYGASVNLQPGRVLPGLRLDVQEARSTPIADVFLGDLRRSLTGGLSQSYGDHQLNLTARVERDERAMEGDAGAFRLTTQQYAFTWGSPRHFSSATVALIDRLAPNLAGLNGERTANLAHAQNFGEGLQADVGASLGEVRSADGRGRRAIGHAGVEWTPFRTEQLSLGVSGEGGLTWTYGSQGSGRGQSYGGSSHISYMRPLGPVQAGVRVAATTSVCRCEFGNQGRSTALDAGISAAALSVLGANLRGDYTLSRVFAPLARGGQRLEHRASANLQYRLLDRTDLGLTFGYNQGTRELYDIESGQARLIRERALSGALLVATAIGPASVSAELRHARGSVVAPADPFFAGEPFAARSLTSAQVLATTPLFEALEARGLLLGSWTELSNSRPLASLGAQAGLAYRFGLLTASVDYNVLWTAVGGTPVLHQSIRGTLARPFSF